MSSGRRPAAAAFLSAALLALSACWTSGLRSIPESTSRYDAIGAPAMRMLRDARDAFDSGRVEEARIALQLLAQEQPDSIVLGVWLQETEIALAATMARTPSPEGTDAMRELAERYAAAIDDSPTVAGLVLAARLAVDEPAARALLDRAAALDPLCAWVPYARAFLAARRFAWDEVRASLERARELDPGHMPARWMECWMLARGGRVREAIRSFDTWIAKAADDPRIDGRLLLEARLDLALLHVLDGDADGAEAILAEAGVAGGALARDHLIAAAAAEADGDPRAALAAAERAAVLAPGELLPVVQQALLAELWLGDAAAAEVAWTKVLALSRTAPDLSALLERVRARVRLERLERQRSAATEDAK